MYQQTVNEIRNAANEVNPNGRFFHGKDHDLSQHFDGAYPLIWLYPFTTEDPAPDANVPLFTSTLILGFWMQDRPDTNEEEREEIIQKMFELVTAFKLQLANNSQIQVTRFLREPQYQMHQGTLSGYACRFTYQNLEPCES